MSDTRPAEAEVGSRDDMKSVSYELFIVATSILSILNLALAAIFEFRSSYWWLVAQIDIALTLIFVIDFIYRLRTASSKRYYLGRGGGVWDFLGCLPGFRIFRLFRVV